MQIKMEYYFYRSFQITNGKEGNKSMVMNELQRRFDFGMERYYPEPRANKRGRRDKYELREKVGFKPQMNPVAVIGRLLDRKARPSLIAAFGCIK